MSGGVDSSVAAALLLGEGYEVVGATMQLWSGDAAEADGTPRCCSDSDSGSARAVASMLGFAHHSLNLRDVFRASVVRDFVDQYARGRTPNPCIRCNEHVKFDALLRRARRLGAEHLATGHHARIVRDPLSGRYRLLRGVDRAKDQSYVLYMLTQAQLAQVLLPVGHLTKAQVRDHARRLGLTVADRPDSQDVCFVARRAYARLVADEWPDALQPGPILDAEGNLLGEHPGIAHYTVGQRKRLGIGAGRRLYVLAIDPARRAVIVGPDERAGATGCRVSAVNWIAFDQPPRRLSAEVQIRYNCSPVACVVTPSGTDADVEFAEPVRGVAPGQAAVFYDGEAVLGGGTIEDRVLRRCSPRSLLL
jgi:tRNA-specific 2-thiouridylase